MRIRINRPVNKSSTPINTTLVAKQQKQQPVNHPKLDAPDPKFNFDLSKIPISSPNRPSSSSTINPKSDNKNKQLLNTEKQDTEPKPNLKKLRANSKSQEQRVNLRRESEPRLGLYMQANHNFINAPKNILRTLPEHHAISSSTRKIQCFGEGGHEKATEQGLKGMFTEEQMKEIQFGNWKTDMNQISLAIPHLKKVGIELTQGDCLEIVRILGIDKFGETIGSRLTADTLGSYKEAEHFDNPHNNPEDANYKKREDAKVQSFFNESIKLITKRLEKVVFLGNTSSGRELLGNTLHTIQDIYAHSNFVEIALKLKGVPIDTMGGKTTSGKPIMTSGIFGGLDTAISIAKMIADKLKEPTKKENKLSAGTRIAIIVLNRNGYRHVSKAYLKVLDMLEKSKKAIIKMVPERYRLVAEIYIQKIEVLFQTAKYLLLKKISDGINNMSQFASQFTGSADHPSHSKLAKDSDSEKRGLYPLANKLATVATRDFGNKIKQIWDLKANNVDQDRIDSEVKILKTMITEYMGHPDDTSWWKSHIR